MTTSVAESIERQLTYVANPEDALNLSRFFQTGPGQYGEGDLFLGVRVPKTREIIKPYLLKATSSDIRILTASPYHEVRLSGFLCLVDQYRRAASGRNADPQKASKTLALYLELIDRGNNWDLVDLVAPKILGDRIARFPEEAYRLTELAQSSNLWRQRVSIVSTWTIIRTGRFDLTLSLADRFLSHPHHLMHKAVGWMLREVGKRHEPLLLRYLDENAHKMPRTALRYAIERLSPSLRSHYLGKTQQPIINRQ